MKIPCKSLQTCIRILIANLLILLIILTPSVALAQEKCDRVSEDVVSCDGVEYVISTRDEWVEIIRERKDLALANKEIDLKDDKISLLEEQLVLKDGIIDIQQEDIEYKSEYILKLTELDKPTPWYESPEFNAILGATITVGAFFLWEYGRSN